MANPEKMVSKCCGWSYSQDDNSGTTVCDNCGKYCEVQPLVQPEAQMMICKCGHAEDLHNKPDSWIPHKGCCVKGCRCTKFEPVVEQPAVAPLKTSDEWQKLFPEVEVLDPDGWDRQNFQYSWFEEKITKMQYEMRLSVSTCEWKAKPAIDDSQAEVDKLCKTYSKVTGIPIVKTDLLEPAAQTDRETKRLLTDDEAVEVYKDAIQILKTDFEYYQEKYWHEPEEIELARLVKQIVASLPAAGFEAAKKPTVEQIATLLDEYYWTIGNSKEAKLQLARRILELWEGINVT
jgi:hypothetical protein